MFFVKKRGDYLIYGILKKLKKIVRIKRYKRDVRSLGFFLFLLGEYKMRFLEEIKRWLGEVTEIFLLLLALGIILEILFGSAVPFFAGIVPNLTALLNNLGDNGLVGLLALSIVLWLFYRKRAPAHS